MFRTVLVPLDGSRFAEAALPTASRLAQDAKAHLRLVLVHEPVAALVQAGDLALPTPEVESELRAREESYLAATAIELAAVCGEPVEFHEVAGAGGPEICEEATRIGADLVVMATHGRGTFRRLWLGSVADYVLRHLSVPLLLVHPDRMDPGSSPSLRGILVALDLSREAEAILEPVIGMAQLAQGHVTLLHVLPALQGTGSPSLPYPIRQDPGLLERQRVEAQRALDAVADRLRERGLSVCARVTPSASPADSLLETLEGQRFDLIAMTTHGAGGMHRLLLGCVTDKVIRGAAKPVLVLRPPPAV